MSKKYEAEPGGPNMTIVEHLEELRKRLWYGLLLLSFTVSVSFYFRSRIMNILTQPFLKAWKKTPELQSSPILNYANPIDPFFTDFKLAILSGLFLGLPLLGWQLWLFVSPGLYKHEKKYILPFLFSSYIFLILGGAFCYFIVLPTAFQFFLNYAAKMGGNIIITPTVMLKDYAGLTLKMLIGFGIIFQLPLVIILLTIAGIVNWKFLLKISRWVIVGTFVISAVLTPTPDVVNQTLMAVPMLILYYASVGASFLLRPRGKAPGKTSSTIDKASQ